MSLTAVLIGLMLVINAPTPCLYPVDYTDFTATEIVETYNDSTSEYTYTTTIENIGTGYIMVYSTELIDSYGYVMHVKGASTYTRIEEYLSPNKSMEVSFVNSHIFNSVKISCLAYPASSVDTEAEPSIYNAVYNKTSKENGKTTIYDYYFTVNSNYDERYDYEVIVSYTYDGVSKTVGTTKYYKNTIWFGSLTDMDISKIKIDSSVFIQRGRSISYDDRSMSIVIATLYGILTLIVYASTIATTTFCGIVAVIILLIMKAVKRSKNKA